MVGIRLKAAELLCDSSEYAGEWQLLSTFSVILSVQSFFRIDPLSQTLSNFACWLAETWLLSTYSMVGILLKAAELLCDSSEYAGEWQLLSTFSVILSVQSFFRIDPLSQTLSNFACWLAETWLLLAYSMVGIRLKAAELLCDSSEYAGDWQLLSTFSVILSVQSFFRIDPLSRTLSNFACWLAETGLLLTHIKLGISLM